MVLWIAVDAFREKSSHRSIPATPTDGPIDRDAQLPTRRLDGGEPLAAPARAERVLAERDAPVDETVAVAPAVGADDPSIELVVHVTSSTDDSPIPQAHLTLGADALLAAEEICFGMTDAAGTWTERDLAELPIDGLWLTVHADGFASHHRSGLTRSAGAQRLEIDCRLAPASVLAGQVVAAGSRAPIRGARLELAPLRTLLEGDGVLASADDNGRFEIESCELPPELSTLLVTAEGWQTARIDRPWSATVEGRLTIELRPPNVRIRGRVVDAVTREPILAGEVEAAPAGLPERLAEGSSTVAALDREGRFELLGGELPAGGPIELRVEAAGHAPWRKVLAWPDGGGDPVVSIDVALEEAFVLRGRVVTSADQAPIRGAIVQVTLANRVTDLPLADTACRTGRDGAYSFTLPASVVLADARLHFRVDHDGRRFELGPFDAASAPRGPAGREWVQDLPVDVKLPIDAFPGADRRALPRPRRPATSTSSPPSRGERD